MKCHKWTGASRRGKREQALIRQVDDGSQPDRRNTVRLSHDPVLFVHAQDQSRLPGSQALVQRQPARHKPGAEATSEFAQEQFRLRIV
jgi:hypothetical protein